MGGNSESDDLSELEWIRVRKDVFDEVPVSQSNKLLRKFKENPFIPIGAIATTMCLVFGVYNLALRRSRHQQFFMRARVLAQGFTVGAFIVGLGVEALKGTDN